MLEEILNSFMADLTNNNIFINNLETNFSAYLTRDNGTCYQPKQVLTRQVFH